jgi:hypothetical protein
VAISTRAHKLLWGRGGNRCALCCCELVMDASPVDREAVVGDECHIVAKEPGGPRSIPDATKDELDAYDNLILLCKTHHKLVDDQPNTFTVGILKALKDLHEEWVRDILGHASKMAFVGFDGTNPVDNGILPRIATGEDLVSSVADVYGYDFGNDSLRDPSEVELISSFFQKVQDFADLIDDLEIADRVQAGYEFSQEIKQLEACGFRVFGTSQSRKVDRHGKSATWQIGVLRIIHNSEA